MVSSMESLAGKIVVLVEPLDWPIVHIVEEKGEGSADVRMFRARMPDASKGIDRFFWDFDEFLDEAVADASAGKELLLMCAGRAFLVAYAACYLLKKKAKFSLLVWSPEKKEYYALEVESDE